MDVNRIGLTRANYQGKPSTLCKGCGHDSITNTIVTAFFELGIPPFQVAKLSGIGCSSKTPTYFLDQSHGFNGVHGRMPSLATGAKLANDGLTVIGVSGDGDTGSIGLGQYCHLMRRNLDMIYIIENNGTYGLTKGQFSATTDIGSKSKKGEPNPYHDIDLCAMAIDCGATFVARSFSGDRKQLVALLKAAHAHKGVAVLDVISPCVTFNNHEGSTKSYSYVKEHDIALHEVGYVPFFEEIHVDMKEGEVKTVSLHDGSKLTLKKLNREYDPSDRVQALKSIIDSKKSGELLTGLLYYNSEMKDLSTLIQLPQKPLAQMTKEDLDPGASSLEKIMASFK